jgi:uncharacterized metal-binding protein
MAKQEIVLTCADCTRLACKGRDEAKYPKFCLTEQVNDGQLEQVIQIYKKNENRTGEISVQSACLEGETYGQLTRVQETIEFIKRMGYQYVGIASCVGLMAETRQFVKILRAVGIKSYTVGCKVGAVDKCEVGVPNEKKLNGGTGHESMCNPIMQAKVLEEQGTDFNIVIGLCVGHDTMFLKYSHAPTTVMIVKDRVLGHNPVMALYTAQSMYSRFKKELGL